MEASNPYCDSAQSVTFSIGSTEKHEKLVRKRKKRLRIVNKNMSQAKSDEQDGKDIEAQNIMIPYVGVVSPYNDDK